MQLRLLPVALLLLAPLVAPAAVAATSPAPGASQWVDATFDLSQPDLRHIVFGGDLKIHEIPIDGKTTTALQFVRAYDAANPSERPDLLGKLATAAQKGLQQDLEAAFPHANVTVGDAVVDQASLADSPSRGEYDPVGLSLSAQIARNADDPTLAGVTDAQLATVFAIGAQVRSTFTLTAEEGYAATYVLHAPGSPASLVFASPSAGTLAPDGRTWTILIDNVAGSAAKAEPLSATVRSAAAPTYAAQKASLGVLVDLKGIDVTLGKAVKGDFGNLNVEVTVTGKINVLALPASIKSRLGDAVTLDYLDADGIRLLKQSGLLTADNVTTIETDLRNEIASKLQTALGQDAPVSGGIDAASLDPSLASSPPNGDKPVTFSAHAAFSMPVGGSASKSAVIALYTLTQSFDLPRVQGLDTTYTLVLPKGLAIKDAQVTGGASQTGTSADGRDQLTVTPTGDSARATVAIAVTPTLVVAKFWPVLLLAVVVLVLVAGTPIALVAMRRRKGRSG